MKQKILMLLTVVLLSSASAFAQSGNSEPLKGDVNGDGMVDVADIAAIIDIMANGGGTATKAYWYAGQNVSDNYITADNYTTIATQSAFTTKAVNMTEGNYLYVVVPSDKIVEITDPAGNVVTMNFYNSSTGAYNKANVSSTGTYIKPSDGSDYAINGYYLIRSRGTAAAETWTVTVKSPETYYWYVGTTVPTDPTNTVQNTGNNEWTSLGNDLPTSDIKINKVDTSYNFSTWYIAAPSAANFTLYNGTNVASNEAAWSKSTFNVGSVQYTLWTSKSTGYQAVGYLHK